MPHPDLTVVNDADRHDQTERLATHAAARSLDGVAV